MTLVGVEPTTLKLRVSCSAIELQGRSTIADYSQTIETVNADTVGLKRSVIGKMASHCYNHTAVTNLHIINETNENQQPVDEKWMRVALDLAAQAMAMGEVPVGAVAVKNGRIVGTGFNRKENLQDPTAHAEMIALREAATAVNNWRLIDVTLYCTVEPCPMCAGAMIQARLPRLVYGTKDTRFGADGTIVHVLGATGFNHTVTITRGILEDEAAALLQQFFQMLRSKKD